MWNVTLSESGTWFCPWYHFHTKNQCCIRHYCLHVYLLIWLYDFFKMYLAEVCQILPFFWLSYIMLLSIGSFLKQIIYKALCLGNCVLISLFRHNSFHNCHCTLNFLYLLWTANCQLPANASNFIQFVLAKGHHAENFL